LDDVQAGRRHGRDREHLDLHGEALPGLVAQLALEHEG
jgi:hypothetical protein